MKYSYQIETVDNGYILRTTNDEHSPIYDINMVFENLFDLFIEMCIHEKNHVLRTKLDDIKLKSIKNEPSKILLHDSKAS